MKKNWREAGGRYGTGFCCSGHYQKRDNQNAQEWISFPHSRVGLTPRRTDFDLTLSTVRRPKPTIAFRPSAETCRTESRDSA